jgi:hypothetical protein
MTCQDYEAELVDLARGRDFGRVSDLPVRTHLAGCASCAARFASEEQLSRMLVETERRAPVLAEPQATAMEQRLRQAFEASRRESTVTTAPASWDWRWLAAAAAVVLAVGGAGWFGFSGREARTSGPATAPAPRTSDVARQSVPAALPTLPTPTADVASAPAAAPPRSIAQPAAVVAAAAQPRSAGLGAAEEVSFVVLPDAVGLPPLESGRIVRVEVPVSSLQAFGFAVVPDIGRPLVDADVLVGQDGQPRGIRIINATLRSRR